MISTPSAIAAIARAEVFAREVEPIISRVVAGFNATVFRLRPYRQRQDVPHAGKQSMLMVPAWIHRLGPGTSRACLKCHRGPSWPSILGALCLQPEQPASSDSQLIPADSWRRMRLQTQKSPPLRCSFHRREANKSKA